jgi:hypothetical protein
MEHIRHVYLGTYLKKWETQEVILGVKFIATRIAIAKC